MPDRKRLEVRVNGAATADGVIRRERGDTGRWIYRVQVPYETLRAGINRLEVSGADIRLEQLQIVGLE
jgi:hypothetical protein